MLITEEYREQNSKLHRLRDDYGAKIRKRHLDAIQNLIETKRISSVLDYGCGKGELSKHIQCANYDPAIPEFADTPKQAQLVVCLDVLEHVEPDHLSEVLDDICSLSLQYAFIVITTGPDGSKTLPDGRDPHLIVKDAEWWIPLFRQRWMHVMGKFTARELQIICWM